MYAYSDLDQSIVDQRVVQFRDQTKRFLAGELSDEAYRPLRLMNGLYLQRHAPMLRVAIPYGLLGARQLRRLAAIARRYDRGYGHFTTRQNIQFNWVRIEEVPEILASLAEVQMHAIQTSGNCIRNVTADHLAGIAPDEIEDPRPYCELIRQWSTLHPEFSFLPRKFKIAVTGSPRDRAASQVHDIGLHLVPDPGGQVGFEVIVGGGLGRTPMIGKVLRPFLEKRHLLSYLEAILRVYNRMGRRDNLYKARIKILVNALGIEAFARQVEEEWNSIRDGDLTLTEETLSRFRSHFAPPALTGQPRQDAGIVKQPGHTSQLASNPVYAAWVRRNTVPHRQPGYRAVTLSLKSRGPAPGDLRADQMDGVADLADAHSLGQVRVTHEQNLLLPHVCEADLPSVWRTARNLGLATPNVGTLTDFVCCPGLDYCSLANAGSIDLAEQIQDRFDDYDVLYDLGEIRINISGCMNACGHHHVGHIGLLGVDKKGEEWYQITLGGQSTDRARLGKVLGPSVPKARVAEVIERLLETYLRQRSGDERFVDTVHRTGLGPFKEAAYATAE
jgi:sulfite reductase (NADPH) hemoprotein beta-component